MYRHHPKAVRPSATTPRSRPPTRRPRKPAAAYRQPQPPLSEARLEVLRILAQTLTLEQVALIAGISAQELAGILPERSDTPTRKRP